MRACSIVLLSPVHHNFSYSEIGETFRRFVLKLHDGTSSVVIHIVGNRVRVRDGILPANTHPWVFSDRVRVSDGILPANTHPWVFSDWHQYPHGKFNGLVFCNVSHPPVVAPAEGRRPSPSGLGGCRPPSAPAT